MGCGSWSSADWTSYSKTASTKSSSAIFTSHRGMKDELNPKGVMVRESRDSTDNPNSTAMIVGLDVTGSMGMIAESLAKEGLGILFQETLDRKPITDPHMMFMAIGDAYHDSAPLQVSQFEADNRIIEQLTGIYLEGGGGGNSFESYDLPWYFASQHTSIDCFEKRGKKGYLFTVGDEEFPHGLRKTQIEEFIGDKVQGDYTSEELFEMASKMYHVFHVIVEEGSHCRHSKDKVVASWRKVLGQRALLLSDYTKLSEVIVSAMQVIEGESAAAVAKSWSGSTSLVVARAIDGLTAAANPLVATSTGAVRL